MTEPCIKSNTAAARKDSLAERLAQGISDCYARFEEAQIYEIAAAMSVEDPHAAHSFLLERREEPSFPLLRRSILSTIELRIDAAKAAAKAAARDRLLLVEGDDAPGGRNDRAREAAFRKSPGAFLPGAVPSIVKSGLPRAFWNISIDGQIVPCAYVCRAAAVSDVGDMVYLLEQEPHRERGIVIGSPETAADLAGLMPPNITFVAVDLNADGRA